MGLGSLLLRDGLCAPLLATYGLHRAHIRLYAANREEIKAFNRFDLRDLLSNILYPKSGRGRPIDIQIQCATFFRGRYSTQIGKTCVRYWRAHRDEATLLYLIHHGLLKVLVDVFF